MIRLNDTNVEIESHTQLLSEIGSKESLIIKIIETTRVTANCMNLNQHIVELWDNKNMNLCYNSLFNKKYLPREISRDSHAKSVSSIEEAIQVPSSQTNVI